MILAIILLIFILLSLALLIAFVFYVLEPSVTVKNKIFDNLLVNLKDASDFYTEQKKKIEVSDKKAFVLKQNKKDIHTQSIDFNSQYTCAMLKSIYFTAEEYNYVCIGLGDCQKVCEQKAIVIEDGVAKVSEICCGCEKCVMVCPQKIIKMVPVTAKNLDEVVGDNEEKINIINRNNIDKNIEWNQKKYFKLWAYCYKIYKIIKVNFN